MVLGFAAAAIAMLIALIPAGIVLCRGDLAATVVAFEFITAVIVMVLALLAQAFQRPSLFELRCARDAHVRQRTVSSAPWRLAVMARECSPPCCWAWRW